MECNDYEYYRLWFRGSKKSSLVGFGLVKVNQRWLGDIFVGLLEGAFPQCSKREEKSDDCPSNSQPVWRSKLCQAGLQFHKWKEERMGRLQSEDRGLDEGSRGRQGYEVVDMLKRKQAALGLSKMRVLDLGFLDCQGIPGLFFFLQTYGLNTGHLIFLLLLSFNNTVINTYMYCNYHKYNQHLHVN